MQDTRNCEDNMDCRIEKNNSIWWARQLFADKSRVVILDTETTGLGSDAEVIQLSIIGLDGQILFDELIKPMKPIPDDVIKIHGITNEMVKDALYFGSYYYQIKRLLADKKVIIYNATYDIRMITQTANLFDDIPYDTWRDLISDYDCAMRKYAVYCQDWDEYRRSYRWKKLPSGDHSALGDCLATLKLIKQMAETELIPVK